MWINPIELKLLTTPDSDSFSQMPEGHTGLPVGNHCGAFGVQRRHHVHEGIDLYCQDGANVFAVEDGIVVAVLPFTGDIANMPWWNDTWVVMVEGASGVVAYGEIITNIQVGTSVTAGTLIGNVTPVLKHDKGRPITMLHLELHKAGARECPAWNTMNDRPETLLDPTPYLITTACGFLDI